MFVVVYADTRQGFQLQHHPIASKDARWMDGGDLHTFKAISNQYYRNRRQTRYHTIGTSYFCLLSQVFPSLSLE